jgi:hypothetical protein
MGAEFGWRICVKLKGVDWQPRRVNTCTRDGRFQMQCGGWDCCDGNLCLHPWFGMRVASPWWGEGIRVGGGLCGLTWQCQGN